MNIDQLESPTKVMPNSDRYSLRPNNPIDKIITPRVPQSQDKYIDGYDFYYAARRMTSIPSSYTSLPSPNKSSRVLLNVDQTSKQENKKSGRSSKRSHRGSHKESKNSPKTIEQNIE